MATGFLGAASRAGSLGAGVELEFVFLPSSSEADGHKPRQPKLKHHKKHPKQWRNSNREGSPLSFWRKVKDGLRYITFSTYRGNYIAPGPGGRRNNIEREPLPGGAGRPPTDVARQAPTPPDSPVAYGERIDPLSSSLPQLNVPPLPSLPPRLRPVPLALPIFRGEKLTEDKPIRYSQQILFVEDTADFVNKEAARQVLKELLDLMLRYDTIEVTILGNAANDWEQKGHGLPYGTNKKWLNTAPIYGYWDNKPYFGTGPYRTVGALMLARARAIGSLLISRGVPAARVHCEIGRFGFGKLGVPSSGARLRRATIVISERKP